MKESLRKKPDEGKYQYIWRIGQYVDSGVLPHWKHISEEINRELGVPEDEFLSESAYRKMYQSAKKFYDEGIFNDKENENGINELNILKRELQKERVKLQTEKNEYNKWLREEARDELLLEKFIESVRSLKTFNVPDYIKPKHNSKSYLLCFGDEHFGAEFEVRGLFNEIINSYSPEIFEDRMIELFNQTLEIIKKDNIDTLHIFSMGDFSDGILRVSQLMKLRYGVIDSTIKYSNFICEWLEKLTKYVRVEYHTVVQANHTELRMLSQPKGTFVNDNVSKFLLEFIKIRLGNNKNFKLHTNPTGYIYANIAGYALFGIHGEVKNMENAMKDYSKIYNTPIDYLIGGHLHHTKVEEVGKNSEVINIPSIIGIDPYSMSLRKASDSSAKLIVFEENKGKVCEYTLKLACQS